MRGSLHSPTGNSGGEASPNSDSERRSPEKFLELIERSKRGRLKIYIGHAAGTGKTVQMLREANDLHSRGKDVIGAYVETHNRSGTVSEFGVLSVLPRKRIDYKGTVIEEMDIDAVLARHPEIAIVDELAHSNAPGSSNSKRWQDVDDLLDAGISVITAVNIQHIESLNPVVEKITGIRVRETVPDYFFESADQIVNLDIAASDLRERLKRGEIYAPEKVETALCNFFTARNLSSLRELALREVARFLDQGRRSAEESDTARLSSLVPGSREFADGPSHLFSGEPEASLTSPIAESNVDPVVMVATSSRPSDIRNLLRKASAIAHRLNTHWYLAYVETPRETNERIDATTQRHLMNNITLAKDLGATVVRLKGKDVARTLADFSREYGVTHAIFGAADPPGGIGSLLGLFKRDIVSSFHALVPHVDLHICGRR